MEREITSFFFFFNRYDSVHASQLKTSLFCLITLCLAPFVTPQMSSGVCCTHRYVPYTQVQVRKCSDEGMSALGSVHSTLSARHVSPEEHTCKEKEKSNMYRC